MGESSVHSEKGFSSFINPPVLFDEGEAGNYLGGNGHALSKKMMQARRFRGLPPCYIKVGRLVRYLQSDLDEFLVLQRRTSTSE